MNTTIQSNRPCGSLDRVVRPLATHWRPVNLQAAKLFWKAPWWTKLLFEDKEEMTRIETKIEDLVDVQQAPPKLPGGRYKQIHDLRGTKLKHKTHGTIALVLGYAYATTRNAGRQRFNKLWWTGHNWASAEVRGDMIYKNVHMWYAFFSGQVRVISSRNWRMAGNYEPITPAGPNNQ